MNKQFTTKCKQDVQSWIAKNRFINGYAFDKRGHKKAVFVARKNPVTQNIELGYAICSHKDQFNKYVGLKIAIDRLSDEHIRTNELKTPAITKILPDLLGFIHRINRYYQTTTNFVPNYFHFFV